jgi:uncharacterized protein (DUF983 family)
MGIFRKGTKPYSMFNLKCPKCHEGDLFPTGSFSLNKPFDMYDNCQHCGQDFMPEPGFYYGAMFISYIFTGWFCILFVLFVHWVLDWSTALSFAALIAIMAIFFVHIFRLARSIWLNINYKYDPSKARQQS